MKPPYLKKLTKKELRKAYSDQWNQNNNIVGENYSLNRDNEHLQTIVHDQEQEIHVKDLAITEYFWQIEQLKQDLADTQEALSRSRQLRKNLQTLADSKHWERAKIEDMALNLHRFSSIECADFLWQLLDAKFVTLRPDIVNMEDWSSVSRSNLIDLCTPYEDCKEETKDSYRIDITNIISHLPTDVKTEWQSPLYQG